MRVGYTLSSEEFTPAELLEQARQAEAAGFQGLWISDHFHPWMDVQGNAPFVWSMVGALSQVCRLPVTTAVTCPTVRIHPAIIAQAAATSAVLHEGRFVLGVGAGEALNEHILADSWPSSEVRREMLEEAVHVMRALWSGGQISHRGTYYTVDNAKLYTRPEHPPSIYVSGFGPKSVDLAARIGDGFLSVLPDGDLVRRYREHGGADKPTAAGYKVCYAPTAEEGVNLAHQKWANDRLPGELSQVLPYPKDIEDASTLVPQDATRAAVATGPDPDAHLEALDRYARAGYDEIYVANIGPHWSDFFDLYRTQILPRLSG